MVASKKCDAIKWDREVRRILASPDDPFVSLMATVSC